jgi:hypothetical protein
MEPVVISLGGRGRAIRVCPPAQWRCRLFGPLSTAFFLIAAFTCPPFPGETRGGSTGNDPKASTTNPRQHQAPTVKPDVGPKPGKEQRSSQGPHSSQASGSVVLPRPEQAIDGSPSPANTPAIERFKVRDEFDNCVVARLHGRHGDKTALILPDGQVSFPSRLVPTNEPFQPFSADQLESLLHEGPYKEYHLLKTEHYLIFYKSTLAFAQDSGRLLDDLYKGLIEAFRRHGFPVHETEFPLVAVIFATERDFRDHKHVDPQVQAYYEFFTNRIFFYQKSERDLLEPRLATLLKPQTVAHEGAHQILSNIGLQPRPCAWPPWLVEGLAEYCATTVTTKKGIVWRGMAAINSMHMVTLRELDDPLSNEINGGDVHTIQVSGQRAIAQTESLLLKSALTPSDYAQAWALTHYLAQKRGDDFIKYLKLMSQIPPLTPRTPIENLAAFREFFGEELTRLDKKLDEYIRKLSQKKNYDPLPYYTVIFAQPLGNGLVRRVATVSQSPQLIEQWVERETTAGGGEPNWEAISWPTRARAMLAAEEWMRRGY